MDLGQGLGAIVADLVRVKGDRGLRRIGLERLGQSLRAIVADLVLVKGDRSQRRIGLEGLRCRD